MSMLKCVINGHCRKSFWLWQSCVGHCGCWRGECGGGFTRHWQFSNNFPPIKMDGMANRFLLCLNTFTSQIICLWLTTIWNNTFTSEIWCLWLTHDPASRWLMASSVTTSRRIALLFFGFTPQSSCCTLALLCRAAAVCKRQKLWQGDLLCSFVHLLYSSACPILQSSQCCTIPGWTSRQAATIRLSNGT